MIQDRPLTDKHAIVTGGGRGIGAAIGWELGRLGASLTLLGRDLQALQDTARDLMDEHAVEVLTIRCDVADAGSVAEAFACSRERYPSPAVLINNAGMAAGGSFLEISRESWDQVIAVNLTGAMLCTREVLPTMLEAGSGRIVNIASTAALRGYRGVSAYVAAKHGLLGLTRALAQEVARRGVTVNAVCPGYTETGMVRQALDALTADGRSEADARQVLLRGKPLGRLITPEEVASTVGWLCTPAASGITGEAIVVAGGEVV